MCWSISRVKFGVILSTDEEQGKSTHAIMARYPELNVGVVLDNDVGGDIGVGYQQMQNPVFVRLTAEGVPAHGSTPWDGLTPTRC